MTSASLVVAQDGELPSGPMKGAALPGPFDCFNINGKTAKGRNHCLVCEYGLQPVVMIFARERPEEKDGPLAQLLVKLDGLVDRSQDQGFLGGFAVFLSPDAQSSATQKTEDPNEIVREAKVRDALHARLAARAEGLKGMVIACMPEAPKAYKLNPKADVTVIFYNRHKVLANWAFEEGKLTEDRIGQIIKTVEAAVAKGKK